ncbi:uncharacterized protein GJ701_002429 [Geothlypis trichas]
MHPQQDSGYKVLPYESEQQNISILRQLCLIQAFSSETEESCTMKLSREKLSPPPQSYTLSSTQWMTLWKINDVVFSDCFLAGQKVLIVDLSQYQLLTSQIQDDYCFDVSFSQLSVTLWEALSAEATPLFCHRVFRVVLFLKVQ